MFSPLLFLHGAGTSDKNKAKYLQDFLNNLGINSLSFNFTGYRGNQDELVKSSLKNRLQEAESAIKNFNLQEPLNILGSSMGGYIAIKLLEKYEVENLILFCPAVYDTLAFEVPFTGKFTQIIRQGNSWKNSDAYTILRNFTGNVLIFIGENDEVIPKELVKTLEQSLKKAEFKEIIYIPGCPHRIHRWLSQNADWRYKVAQKISKLLSKKL